MKELSIEEKAKAYDEAIERAKSKIKDDKDHVLYEDDVIEIFPELKESEGERIIKELIKFINDKVEQGSVNAEQFVKYKSWITWLEKNQGEQKPAEWSEEDEKKIRGLLSICDVYSTKFSFYPKENKDIEGLKNWLNFLKDRCTWKPSDEQMFWLHWLSTNILIHGEVEEKASEILDSLYNDLKKLKV